VAEARFGPKAEAQARNFFMALAAVAVAFAAPTVASGYTGAPGGVGTAPPGGVGHAGSYGKSDPGHAPKVVTPSSSFGHGGPSGCRAYDPAGRYLGWVHDVHDARCAGQ
jgi:hypothetical protein